ncbi:MAG: hypothetical protein Fur0046_33290 [Cyanobacteria bacterium J069]
MLGSVMNMTDMLRLAEGRGCTLKISLMDDRLIYWVESRYFVGRPYWQMDDLIEFIEALPNIMPNEAAVNFGL